MYTKSKISVIIPVYNVEDYIEACINNVMSQTYRNLEIILVDDGSTDKSIEYSKSITKNDNRFIYLSKKNSGLSDARNFGTMHSTGEYIIFIDSDDAISKNCIEKLYIALKNTESDIAIGNYQNIYNDEKVKSLENANSEYIELNAIEAFQKIYSENLHSCITFTTAWNKLYRSEIVKQHYFPSRKKHEDEFFTYKMYMDAEKVVYIDDVTYFYRIRPNSIMSVPFDVSNLDVLEAYKERIELLRGYDDQLLLETERNLIYHLYRCRKNLYKNNLKKYAVGFRKQQIIISRKIFFKLNVIKKMKIIKWILF